MAALMRHGAFTTVRILPGRHVSVAAFATKAEKKKGLDRKMPPKIEFSAQSIAAKGFLRPQKHYAPPHDVEQRLHGIFGKILGVNQHQIKDHSQKFELISACAKEFDHSVPNSLLHTIESSDDVENFYTTPVIASTPLDMMRHTELPENLHVQFEYHRFHPETDTRFGGQTAFNRSSTFVTGLKYKDKYKGHNQNQTWPYNS